MVELSSELITGIASVLTAALTALITTHLKFKSEKRKLAEDWRSRILEKYYDSAESFQKLAQQFAIGILFFEDDFQPGHQEKVFIPKNFNMTLGRLPSNDIVTPDPTVSRVHSLISSDDRHVWLEDLFTTNPTLVNGEPLVGRRRLEENDVIVAGATCFLFKRVGGWIG